MQKSISTLLVMFSICVFTVTTFYLSKKNEFAHPILQGTWSRCIEGQLKHSYIFKAKGVYERRKDYYLNKNNCKGPLSYSHSIFGSYKTDNRHYQQNATHLDLTVTVRKTSLKVIAPETVAIYNDRTVCNINNWKQGEEREVTGVQADDCSQYKAGLVTYRRLKLEGNTFKIGDKTFELPTIKEDFKAGLYRKAK